uniref:Uncharacterized protein TCIL3000_2_1090 n=1 Tax=Trypanosoma congolense (strain IL3000) TaxID=1068625 RepID=G0UJH8_TRYCI|nr:unnamed protein product [Trypanosoma congolense IL3000]
MSCGCEAWLPYAQQRDVESVLRLAEEFEISSPCVRLSSHFFRLLTMGYLTRNDVIKAKCVIRRWNESLKRAAITEDDNDARARLMLQKVADYCARYAYGNAFKEMVKNLTNSTSGEDVACLQECLLDNLAARYVEQRTGFYSEANDLRRFAAALDVSPADVEARLQRVRMDHLRCLQSASAASVPMACETLRCAVQMGG